MDALKMLSFQNSFIGILWSFKLLQWLFSVASIVKASLKPEFLFVLPVIFVTSKSLVSYKFVQEALEMFNTHHVYKNKMLWPSNLKHSDLSSFMCPLRLFSHYLIMGWMLRSSVEEMLVEWPASWSLRGYVTCGDNGASV